MDYYKDTKWFNLYNPNPTEGKKAKKSDCVIRALAVAADITWLESFDLLVENARKTYNVPNDPINYSEVFKNMGFDSKTAKAEKGRKRMTVENFCKTHPKGRHILRVANHLTPVVDGICYDTWNTSECCVYRYWELK